MSHAIVNVQPANEKALFNEDVDLRWKNICYDVTLKDKSTKRVIDSAFGEARPGELLAIMGASGAGKSTTLDLILGRIKPTEGKFLINSKPRTKSFKYISSYVQQEDSLIPVLTVRETIQFSARLRLPSVLSSDTINERVESIITSMGLNRCADSRVGNFLVRGISGGEKRRVSIASELVTDPKVIILDEPTSGLDSEASLKVIQVLSDFAKERRKTVLCTIHQPSSSVFNKFDKLLLLAQGRTIYCGPVQNAVGYFEYLGHPCPSFYNPADHFLSILNTDFAEDQEKAKAKIEDFANKFQSSQEGQRLSQSIESEGSSSSNALTSASYNVSHVKQTLILTQRSYINAARNILLYWIRAAMYVAMAILMGTTWYDVGLSQTQIQDRFSVHFFAIAFLCFMSVAAIPGIIEEKSVFDRENRNGAYSVSAYVISNTLTSLPFVLAISLIFCVIAYPMLMLQSGVDKIFTFVLVLFLSLYTIESIVVVISAIVPIFVVALAIVSFLNGFFMCVQGYFVRYQSLPDFWVWGHYWSYETYAFEALVKSDFDGLIFKCSSDDPATCFCQFPPDGSNPCEFSGKAVLKEFGYEDVNILAWICILIGQIIIYRLIFYCVLRYKTRFRH